MAKQLQQNRISQPAAAKCGRLAFAMTFPEQVITESSLFGSPGDPGEGTSFYQYLNKRKNFYRLLARYFISEPSEGFIKEIVIFPFPTISNNSEMDKGVSTLKAYIKDGKLNLTELDTDYIRTFHGMNPKSGMAVPYESVYTSPHGMIMQDAFEKVLRIFYAHGFDYGSHDRHPDHAGLELEFMAYLCQKSQEAIEKTSPGSLRKTLADQKEFLQSHLLNWMPEFLTDVKHFSETPFYQSAALITSGYLQLEKERFANC